MSRDDYFNEFEKVFWQLSRKMEYMWHDIYAQTFPGSQSQIMYLLLENGPQKMSELAESLHITAGAVTTAANLLIEKGYILRLRSKDDRRIVYLEITEMGKSTLQQLQKQGKQVMKTVFENVTDEQFESMHNIFIEASKNINQLSKNNH